MSDFYLLWQRKRQTIIIIVLLSLIITVAFTLMQTFKYSSRSKMLVVEKFPTGTDIYTISRSQEYLSSLLAALIKTDSFYRQVLDSGFNIDKSYFLDYFSHDTHDKAEVLKKWSQTVKAKTVDDTGIIEIEVFHPSKYQAEQINKAIDYVLKTKHQQYHGNPNVSLAEIEAPIISDKIVQPNVYINIALGFFVGLLAALLYVYLFPEPEYNLRLWPQKQNKKEINLSAPTAPLAEDLEATVSYYDQVSAKERRPFSPAQKANSTPPDGFKQTPPEPIGVSYNLNNQDEPDFSDLTNEPSFGADKLKGSMENILG